MTRLIIVLFFLIGTYLNAQDWDILTLEKEDTSLTSRKIIELASGDLFLLTVSFVFIHNSVGVFIEGFPRYGFDLININQEHQIDTNFFIPLSPKFSIGNLLNFDEHVIVPIEVFTGIEPCESPFPYVGAASQATDMAFVKLNAEANEYLEDTLYIHRDSSMCGPLDFLHFSNCQNILHALRYNFNESRLLLELIQPESMEIIESYLIDLTNSLLIPSRAYFDCESESFLIHCASKTLCKMDFSGNIQWSLDSIRTFIEAETSLDKDFYWLRAGIYGDNYGSIIYKVDRQGNLITNWIFENRYFQDIEPLVNGMLIVLENGENEILLHIINENGRIISTQNFVYERIVGRSIKLLSSGEVVIIADKVDAFNLEVCCIEVGENSPNKVLVIKTPLESIWNPEISEKEEFIVLPNPTMDKIEILFKEYYFNLEGNFHYALHSLDGKKLREGNLYAPSHFISLSSLPVATYLLSIYDGDIVIETKKIIKY